MRKNAQQKNICRAICYSVLKATIIFLRLVTISSTSDPLNIYMLLPKHLMNNAGGIVEYDSKL